MIRTVLKRPAAKPAKPAAQEKKANTKGNSLAPSAAQPSQWRCQVCTFLNPFELDECSKCQEPVTESQKQQQSASRERQIRLAPGSRVVAQPSRAAGSVPAAKAAAKPLPPAPASKSSVPPAPRAKVHGITPSRLNQNTASSRGKLPIPPLSEHKSGANIHTISSPAAPAALAPAPAAPAPAVPTSMARLQAASHSNVMPSMRHAGRGLAKPHKN
eukprot:TRINITY_DN3023_c0_g2_i4.p1 TRINITY_DN3023_c0_g2~~TRINITY_DN3023_c0_g2_i4.p1  ORF type:complete len:215 (+),score=28.22 TRINITY_DN3023_c0_g2_i4:90-734(+)